MRFSSSILVGLASFVPLASALSDVPSSRMSHGDESWVIAGYPVTDVDAFARIPAAVEYEGALLTLDCGPASPLPVMTATFISNAGDMVPTTYPLVATFKKEGTDVATFAYKDEVKATAAELGKDSYHATVEFDIIPGTWAFMCDDPVLTIDLRPACEGDLNVVFDLKTSTQSKFGKNSDLTGNGRIQVNCDASVTADVFASVQGADVVGDTCLLLKFDLTATGCDLGSIKMKIDSDRTIPEPGVCMIGMDGDPHVKTWAGKWFDFMGECDLMLVQDDDFDGRGHELQIQTRTTIRFDYSFIEVAAVKLGDDVLEVGAFGHNALNGVVGAFDDDVPLTMGGYPVYHTQINKKRHQYDIVLSPKANITLGSFKDLVSVHLDNAQSHIFFQGEVKGIMGGFDGRLLARDGETEMEDMVAFGQEWQLLDSEPMLFTTTRAPQYPAKCNMPSAQAKQGRRLGQAGVSQEAAELACAHHGSHGMPAFENCVYDVMAVGDLEMASAGAQ